MSPKQQNEVVRLLVNQEFAKRKKEYELRCIQAITATYAITLHDKFGWDKEKINQLIAESTEQFKLILDKFVTLDDFTTWAQEYGLVGV